MPSSNQYTNLPMPLRLWVLADEDERGCWVVVRKVADSYGYVQLMVDGSLHQAHRLAYELMVGEILPGLQLDHLCRNRACINPYHLDQVTVKVNVQRGSAPRLSGERMASKTHCPHGHPYSTENTYVNETSGGRTCKTCRREKDKKRRPRTVLALGIPEAKDR